MSPISEGETFVPSETHKMHRHSHNKVLSLQTTNGFLHVACLLAKVQQECSSCRVSALSFNYYLIKAELTTTAVAPPATVLGGYPGAFHLRSRRYFIIFALVEEA